MALNKRTIKDLLPLAGKRVLLRVDFNVPIKNGVIGDDTRIRAALPTIQFIIANGASAVLMSHLGRPKGVDLSQSTKPAAVRLAELLGMPVKFAEDCVGPVAEAAAQAAAAVHGGRANAGEATPARPALSPFLAHLAALVEGTFRREVRAPRGGIGDDCIGGAWSRRTAGPTTPYTTASPLCIYIFRLRRGTAASATSSTLRFRTR